MGSDRIIVVDENNVPIGVKRRDEIDYSVDIYRSTGIWITNSRGQILIAQRSLMKKLNPGLWGPAAAGTVDEGETYESNASKELAEELGVKGFELEPHPAVFYGAPYKQFMQWFGCVCDLNIEDFTVQKEEVEQIRWVSPQELLEDFNRNPTKFVPSIASAIEIFGVIG